VPGFRRAAARCAAAVLLAAAPALPAAADCLDWDDETVQIVQGALDGVPGVGAVSYRIAYSYAGFNHHLGAVELHWTAGGMPLRQLLFHGIHDNPPAVLAPSGAGLALSVQFCAHGAETCETLTATYAYDPAVQRFRGADAAGRALDASGCG